MIPNGNCIGTFSTRRNRDRPLKKGRTVAGPALTLQCMPKREDLYSEAEYDDPERQLHRHVLYPTQPRSAAEKGTNRRRARANLTMHAETRGPLQRGRIR